MSFGEFAAWKGSTYDNPGSLSVAATDLGEPRLAAETDELAPISSLIDAIVATTGWATDAACRDANPDLFYVDVGGTARWAKELCSRCPVAARCLEEGLNDPHGIWGGTTERERRVLRAEERKAA